MIPQPKKLIFPTDFSDVSVAALPMAKYFAQKMGAEIVFLYVIEPPTGVAKVFSDFDEERALQESRKMLAKFIADNETPSDANTPFSLMVKIGKPYQKIVEAIDEVDAAIAILGTAGAKGLHATFVGSNTGKVIRMTNCPVVSIKNGVNEPDIQSILLPIGIESPNNHKILGAIHYAKLLGANIDVVAFVPKDEEGEAQNIVNKVKEAAEERGVNINRAEVVVLTESATAAVLQFAQYASSDMIAVLTENDPTLNTALLESASEYIVHRSEIPVLNLSNPISYRIGRQSYFG
jgi:nucleotide-binding universal stress UspA family protein